ncbi:hypothetical protein Tco_0127797 [Tanacetum coccineum]
MLAPLKFLCSSGLKQLQQHVLLKTVHLDGENLDKMKEKGDACILLGILLMASDHVSSDPGPQCSTTVLEQDSLSPGPQSQENVPQVAETETQHQNEVECTYSMMDLHLKQVLEILLNQLEQDVARNRRRDVYVAITGGDKLVSWSSKKQDCTSMSSAEAEYVSLSACCAQVLWLRTQLTDYGFHFDKIPMYCDSKAAIAILGALPSPTLPHQAHRCQISLHKGTDRFKYLVRRLGMRCLTPDELEVLAIESA